MMTLEAQGHTRRCLALHLLTSAWVIAVVGIPATASDPELVFEDLYHVIFTGDSLNRFYSCLCNANSLECSADYKLRRNNNLGYIYAYNVDDIDSEGIQESADNYGANYLCDPGGFATQDSLTCTRLRHNDLGCDWDDIDCRRYTVRVSGAGCQLACVTVVWSGYFIQFKNFPEPPQSGECSGAPGVISTTMPTDITVSSTQTNGNGSSGGAEPAGGDSDDDSVALGAGLGCAAVVLVVIIFVAGFILWRRRRHRHLSMEKPNLPHVSHPHVKTGTHQRQSGEYMVPNTGGLPLAIDNAGYEKDAQNDADYAAYLEPASIYASIADEDVTSATYVNTKDVSDKKGWLSEPHDEQDGKRENITIKEELQKSKETESECGGDIKSLTMDYSKRFGGSPVNKGQEVSRSFLARYNNPLSLQVGGDDTYESYENPDSSAKNAGQRNSDQYSLARPISDNIVPEESQNAQSSAPKVDMNHTTEKQDRDQSYCYAGESTQKKTKISAEIPNSPYFELEDGYGGSVGVGGT